MALEWKDYLDAVAGMPARETCLKALGLFEEGEKAKAEGTKANPPPYPLPQGRGAKLAVDLGCGDGRDTVEMVKRGWRVVANDTGEEGLRRLVERLEAMERRGELAGAVGRVVLNREPFTVMEVPWCWFVNASFSIPHCHRHEFGPMWERIVAAIEPGGRFSGQFFGVRDSWTGANDGIVRTFHTREEVERMLEAFELEHFEEVERPGKTSMGDPKYWHVFHVVGRKR
ncbi:MAG: class I SAM-dependent methyltransferase [Phycisphaerales bacterium]